MLGADITPAMILAGAEALRKARGKDAYRKAVAAFRAMEEVMRAAKAD